MERGEGLTGNERVRTTAMTGLFSRTKISVSLGPLTFNFRQILTQGIFNSLLMLIFLQLKLQSFNGLLHLQPNRCGLGLLAEGKTLGPALEAVDLVTRLLAGCPAVLYSLLPGACVPVDAGYDNI